jgi:hypothetical protein
LLPLCGRREFQHREAKLADGTPMRGSDAQNDGIAVEPARGQKEESLGCHRASVVITMKLLLCHGLN